MGSQGPAFLPYRDKKMILLKKLCQAQWLAHAVYNASQDTHAMFFAFFSMILQLQPVLM